MLVIVPSAIVCVFYTHCNLKIILFLKHMEVLFFYVIFLFILIFIHYFSSLFINLYSVVELSSHKIYHLYCSLMHNMTVVNI